MICKNTGVKLVRYVTGTTGSGNSVVVKIVPAGLRRHKQTDSLISIAFHASGLDSHGSIVLGRSSMIVTLPKKINALSRIFRMVTTTALSCRHGGMVFCGVGNF